MSLLAGKNRAKFIPAASEPSRDAGVLSNTWTIYKQGHRGAPPPILIPTRLPSSFLSVQLPDVIFKPLFTIDENYFKKF